MRQPLTIFIVFFLLCVLCFKTFQHQSIYDQTLGKISTSIKNENGQRSASTSAFTACNDESYIQWDGVHYQEIKNNYYDIKSANGDYIFAFFPLFPMVWKLTGLAPTGVILLNYILAALGIFILFRSCSSASKPNYSLLILALALPTQVIFLLPYTESLFLFLGAVGIYGLVKQNYTFYFLGFMLCALTRSTFTILMASILFSLIYFAIANKTSVGLFKSMILKLLPLAVGTILVSFFQVSFEGGGHFKFIEVLNYWGHQLAIPTSFSGWSHESFGMAIGAIFFVLLPVLGFAFRSGLDLINGKTSVLSSYSPLNFISFISILFLIGTLTFIFFFQGGNLHGLARYTFCPPFFYVLFFGAFKFLENQTAKRKILFLIALAGLSTLAMTFLEYSNPWNFQDLGFIILLPVAFLWINQDQSKTKWYLITLSLTVLLNIVWTSFLFNNYLSNGWLFT